MDKNPKNSKKWWLYGALTTFIIAAVGAVLVLFVFNDNKKKHYDDDDEDEDGLEVVYEERDDESDEEEMAMLEEEDIYEEPEIEEVLVEEVVNSDKFTAYEAEDEIDDVEYRSTEELTVVEAETPDDDRVFDVVEQQPTFSGGDPRVWIGQNIHYPPVAEENGVQGTVVCQFVVERDGSISNVTVARGADPALDKEAIRVIKSMPRWTPGKQNGQTVRVKYTMPIKFNLQ